jgi:hypothetical protein
LKLLRQPDSIICPRCWSSPAGHLGVCRSDGVILDFAVTVNENAMAFGWPARYVQLQPDRAAALRDQVRLREKKTLARCWDEWMQFSSSIYAHKTYSFLSDNCHAFVASFLNSVRYGEVRWDAVRLAATVFVAGRYVDGVRGFARTWAPFALVATAGWWLGKVFLLIWVALGGALVGWFVLYTSCIMQNHGSRILSV